jgi:N-acetylneuraminic acid mutarotase
MVRAPFLSLALTLSLLTLAACSEDTNPTQPGTVGERSPEAPSFALARNTWTKRARLPEGGPRGGLAAGVVNNSAGQPILYVLGGHFDEFQVGQVRAYNYAKNTWTTKATFVERSYTNGVGRIGGKLYFSGGYLGGRDGFCCDATQRTLYTYDPVADRLIRKADMPRQTAAGVTGVINGRLYVLSGTCADDEPPVFDCDVESNRRLLYRYDPATNTWTTLGPAPHSHAGGTGGVISGKFYVAGGGTVANKWLDVYDPVTNSWRTLADLPEARTAVAGTILQNKLYVIGGIGPSGNRAVFAYDPVTNTWKPRASLNIGRTSLAAASLITPFGNPKILAAGGFDASEGPGANELYTP